MDLLHLEFCRAQSQYGMRVDIVESSAHSDVVINRNNNDASPTATREGSQVLAGTARTVHNELRVPTNRCADPLMQEQSRKTLEALGHLSLCHPNKSVTRPKLPSSHENPKTSSATKTTSSQLRLLLESRSNQRLDGRIFA